MSNYTKTTRTTWYKALCIIVFLCLASALGLLSAVWASPQKTLGDFNVDMDAGTYLRIDIPIAYFIIVILLFH